MLIQSSCLPWHYCHNKRVHMLNAGRLLRPDKWVGLSGFGLRVQANLHLILKHQDVPCEKGEETRLRTTRTNREQLPTISVQLLQE